MKAEEKGRKCDDYDAHSDYCPRCVGSLKNISRKSSISSVHKKFNSVKLPVKSSKSNYVMQIISTGVRSDNVYEIKLLLASEIDMSSIKITVKNNNLRVTANQPLSSELRNQLTEITKVSVRTDLMKKIMKYCENFFIPEEIDDNKVSAIIDNKHRLLILTAPMTRSNKE